MERMGGQVRKTAEKYKSKLMEEGIKVWEEREERKEKTRSEQR